MFFSPILEDLPQIYVTIETIRLFIYSCQALKKCLLISTYMYNKTKETLVHEGGYGKQ